MQILDKLLKDDPDSPNALKLLALIHAAKGDTDKAIQLATKARQSAINRGDEKLAKLIDEHLKQYRDKRQTP